MNKENCALKLVDEIILHFSVLIQQDKLLFPIIETAGPYFLFKNFNLWTISGFSSGVNEIYDLFGILRVTD